MLMANDKTGARRKISQKTTRIVIVAAVLLFVAVSSLIAILGAEWQKKNPSAVPGTVSRFGKFAESEGIGTVSTIDGGVGIDEGGALLVLKRQPPAAEEKQFVIGMFAKYRQLDHGENLSIVAPDPVTGKNVPVAVCRYVDQEAVIYLYQNGTASTMTVPMRTDAGQS
jgi:hypothetical protein